METIEIFLIWFFSLLLLGLILKVIIEYIILKKFINNINKVYPTIDIENK